MTFPTKADIEFFKEAKRIQELCVRRALRRGDWVYHKVYGHGIVTSTYDAPHYYRIEYSAGSLKTSLENVILLPRLDQLIEMLEERGWGWSLYPEKDVSPDSPTRDGYTALVYKGRYPKYVGGRIDWECSKIAWAPTPSIALGKCLLEVLDG